MTKKIAQLLNRLRTGNHTQNDIKILKKTKITNKHLQSKQEAQGFMQSYFPLFVYFKCLSEFLLYFYKCSTSMAFT